MRHRACPCTQGVKMHKIPFCKYDKKQKNLVIILNLKQYLDFLIGRVYDKNRNAHGSKVGAGRSVHGHGMRLTSRQMSTDGESARKFLYRNKEAGYVLYRY